MLVRSGFAGGRRGAAVAGSVTRTGEFGSMIRATPSTITRSPAASPESISQTLRPALSDHSPTTTGRGWAMSWPSLSLPTT
jgi:hypothetical protein